MFLKMSSISKFKRIKFEPVTVKEPHKYEVMTFADPDEFTEYYRSNEEKFRNISTLALNKPTRYLVTESVSRIRVKITRS